VISFLRAIRYGIGRAFGGAARRPLVSVLATGAIAVSLVLVGVVYLAARNVAHLTGSWGGGVQMVVYLEDDATPERAREIARILGGVEAVTKVDYVPPDVAMRRLEESLGDRKELLDGIEVGYLPASLEVTLAGGVRDVAAVSPLVDKLKHTQGVEEVEFLSDWVDRLGALLRSLRLAAMALAVLVAAACIYVVAGTIKLGVYARKDELEVLKLVGATDRFVKAPLVLEGALQGGLGAGAAVGLLYALYRLGAPALERMLEGAIGTIHLSFLPAREAAIVIGVGAALGVVGSWVAIGRYADA
jgi:cell division transport system permease protein